jgi:hypothetical protein
VVDVGMGKHHHVDVLGAEAEAPIAFHRFRATALKQSAVEQHASVFGVHDVP